VASAWLAEVALFLLAPGVGVGGLSMITAMCADGQQWRVVQVLQQQWLLQDLL
jgi:hypothetical protein